MLRNNEALPDVEIEYMVLANDRDPRMRAMAVQGMEVLCNDKCLSLSSYRGITELCDDTDTNVRLSALRIVLVFAENYKEQRIKNSKGYILRIQDDAFAVVCHAVNDNQPEVRAEAARLLGNFTSVSDSFLHQTLDKKLMRQMRMLNESTTMNKTPSGGGWSTGKKLGEDVPMEKDDEESHSLIPTGTCGAFVTALEDEFMAVRQAAVYSLGRLAMNRQDFARMCIDHLADMFNDEIQEVRLDAIRSLAPLVMHGTLQQDQLYTILTVLDDASVENRMAIHDLIAKSNLADPECVRQCIRVLLHSLKRFPLDKFSIYQCLSAVGLKHSLFVHGLTTELLEIHPVFDTPEQHIDDDFYLGKLILVLNAASRHPVICSLLPLYVKKHYRFLRCSSPHLIPVVKGIEESKSLIHGSQSTEIKNIVTIESDKVDELLESTYDRIVGANRKEGLERTVLFDMILRDLRAFQSIEEEIAIPAGFLYCFCTVLRIYNLAINSARTDEEMEPVSTTFDECREKIFWIENQFSGLDKQVLARLQECLFRLFMISAAVKLDAVSGFVPELEFQLIDILERTQRRFVELDVTPSESLCALFEWIRENVLTSSKMSMIKTEMIKQEDGTLSSQMSLGQRLISELEKWPFIIPKKIDELRKISMKAVKIVDPNKNFQNDIIVRFVAGLPTGILFSCILSNLNEDDLQRFRIQIKYPDRTTSYFRPKRADFHCIDGARVMRLHTTVVISAPLWAEPANVQLICGIQFEASTFNCTRRSSHSVDFVPLPDAELRSRINLTSVKIHPMQRV